MFKIFGKKADKPTPIVYEAKTKQISKAAEDAIKLSKILANGAKRDADKSGELTLRFKNAQFVVNKDTKPEEIKKQYEDNKKCIRKLLRCGKK